MAQQLGAWAPGASGGHNGVTDNVMVAHVPVLRNPNWRHTTAAPLVPHWPYLLHTVAHTVFLQNSTLPSCGPLPSTSRTAPSARQGQLCSSSSSPPRQSLTLLQRCSVEIQGGCWPSTRPVLHSNILSGHSEEQINHGKYILSSAVVCSCTYFHKPLKHPQNVPCNSNSRLQSIFDCSQSGCSLIQCSQRHPDRLGRYPNHSGILSRQQLLHGKDTLVRLYIGIRSIPAPVLTYCPKSELPAHNFSIVVIPWIIMHTLCPTVLCSKSLLFPHACLYAHRTQVVLHWELSILKIYIN